LREGVSPSISPPGFVTPRRGGWPNLSPTNTLELLAPPFRILRENMARR